MRFARRKISVATALALVVSGIIFGSFLRPHLAAFHARLSSGGYRAPKVFDDLSNRQRQPCPPASESIVLVAFGQSNSANSAGHRSRDDSGRVFSFHEGQCHRAQDPLPGATGTGGSPWIKLAQRLAERTGRKVVLQTFGVGMTSIRRWTDDKDLGHFADLNLAALKRQYDRVDYVLWVQGESDVDLDPAAYGAALPLIEARVRRHFPDAIFGLSSTTYCAGDSSPTLAALQSDFARGDPRRVWLGNTDRYSAWEYRWDDCHFSERGIDALVEEFAGRLVEQRHLSLPPSGH